MKSKVEQNNSYVLNVCSCPLNAECHNKIYLV